jgi:hypothetical protein
MCSSIRKFWQRLEFTVHPDDEHVFENHRYRHAFNLEFPPPAFIGDVDNALIVILMGHGGYDSKMTPSEFPEPTDHVEYRRWLKGEGPIPRNLSSYYTGNKVVFDWIRNGDAVIVNAVAYRTPKIRERAENDRIAKLLPSLEVHRKWFFREVLSDAKADYRRVVAHHPRLWGLQRVDDAQGIIAFPPSHLKYLPRPLTEDLGSWLAGKRKRQA